MLRQGARTCAAGGYCDEHFQRHAGRRNAVVAFFRRGAAARRVAVQRVGLVADRSARHHARQHAAPRRSQRRTQPRQTLTRHPHLAFPPPVLRLPQIARVYRLAHRALQLLEQIDGLVERDEQITLSKINVAQQPAERGSTPPAQRDAVEAQALEDVRRPLLIPGKTIESFGESNGSVDEFFS